ncbi:MAG: hypothetical protein K6F94_01140 [Bacteroidaceae bacterium]|nr:hypothetical protein [Bacteroidaceae bacterium]
MVGCLMAAIPQKRTPDKKRGNKDTRVILIHSDKLYFKQRSNPDAQILVGNVCFHHDGAVLTCDSALYYEASNSFDAFGHVHMIQSDTLDLVSDVLFYNGFDQLARARYNVILKHTKNPKDISRLYCDSLDYDRIYDLGYFFEGGRLVDNKNTLTSEWGQYSPGTREAVFNYNVELKGENFTLISDTLHYNTGSNIANIVGRSNIDSGDNHIYSENGTYDTNNDHAVLLDRSIVQNKGRNITGDSLDYVGKDSISRAFGNVVYIDEVNKNMFKGGYAMFDDINDFAEATDSAVLIDYSQRDTFYCHADTFRMYSYDVNTDSVWREMRAYFHVRAFRKDIQAVCDSMVYISLDSCLTMYRDPIVWQNGQQLLGEEIKVWMNDSTIDSTQVIRQALSVERIDSIKYNQITGNLMHSYFLDGKMDWTWVDGNVLVNYFMYDDDSLLIGMNHLESTELRLYMNRDTSRLRKIFTPGGTGKLSPFGLVSSTERYLENFVWFDYVRPLHKDDIWEWRPKKAGTELKASVRRAPPKQKLGNKPQDKDKPAPKGKFQPSKSK